jgi:predicted nucleic-acid-binding protein
VIALDTNVLVRFLVRDDDKQAARAEAALRLALERGDQLFVSDVVLCELAWVLTSAYELSRGEITDALEKLVASAQLRFHDADALRRAIGDYRSRRGDFADYVIQAQAQRAGCRTVLTFDRALLRDPGFASP